MCYIGDGFIAGCFRHSRQGIVCAAWLLRSYLLEFNTLQHSTKYTAAPGAGRHGRGPTAQGALLARSNPGCLAFTAGCCSVAWHCSLGNRRGGLSWSDVAYTVRPHAGFSMRHALSMRRIGISMCHSKSHARRFGDMDIESQEIWRSSFGTLIICAERK